MPKNKNATKSSIVSHPDKQVKKGKRKLPPKASMDTIYVIKRKDKNGKWREYGMKPTWKFVFNRKPEKKQKSKVPKENPGK